ncbi:MAG TPA: alanine--tRNA ligase [Gemmatimonadales bacterium]|nr:alanine--tRNA ligase [Gemmatimonadales bacterium]
MNASRIRRLFLDFFVANGHREVPSSSLVPADDPTLLFTNAGMVQFKRTFLGQETRPYDRAVTSQKCVRAGGKHNDLEQVGLTTRHHTFFEMLGNFSFGDYFKRDAIAYAWEFVTGEAYLGLHPDRIITTVHHTDDEARVLWHDITGLPTGRIFQLGDADNFWQMGDTGPCGPCSEIFVDLEWKPGSTPPRLSQAAFEEQAEAGRFLEIWNLVFMQYNRSADGELTPLPKPSVDTGAGLERIAAVMQGQDDNFHTDLFQPLLDRVTELVERPYPQTLEGEGASFRVLADHARAVAFLLADGVYPGNEGRGYVLRRILRRAVRHAWLLGRREPTLAPLTELVVEQLGDVYPELVQAKTIATITRKEEEQFLDTIEGGLKRLEDIFASGVTTIAGDEIFKLYDTFGFPPDLTQLIAAERKVGVDLAGFDQALEKQRERSRAVRVSAQDSVTLSESAHVGKSTSWTVLKKGKQHFVGYQATEAETQILAFRQQGEYVELVLEDTPFYAEAGGQVSDTGGLTGQGWSILVESVRRDPERGIVVGGSFDESFEPTLVEARVDAPRRRNIERNHSATHLVHYALRDVLGTHVRQQGSLVAPERLRFDFSHHGPIDPDTLSAIERLVNELVWENIPVETREMPYQEALRLGAMAFFAEKYGDVVRVVTMGPSIELCGGTHVRSTGQMGLFRFSSQTGVAAGVRRIEAVTGSGAYDDVASLEARMAELSDALKARPDHLMRRVEQILEERNKLEARLAAMVESGTAGTVMDEKVFEIDGVALTVGQTLSDDRDEVGTIADRFREGRRNGVLVLFSDTGRGAVHAAVTDDLVKRGRKAGDLVNRIAAISGGRGGGRPSFASAGAGDVAKIPAAREATPAIVASWLTGADA